MVSLLVLAQRLVRREVTLRLLRRRRSACCFGRLGGRCQQAQTSRVADKLCQADDTQERSLGRMRYAPELQPTHTILPSPLRFSIKGTCRAVRTNVGGRSRSGYSRCTSSRGSSRIRRASPSPEAAFWREPSRNRPSSKSGTIRNRRMGRDMIVLSSRLRVWHHW